MLEGVRVVDRTTQIAGPYCTKLLADAGAEVVNVASADGAGVSAGLYEYLNTSKRSAHDDGNETAVTEADLHPGGEG